MNFAALLLPERMVEALGWTLFHALWQGALAALGFAVVLYFTRRTGARLRYGLGLAALALTLLMAALTFWNHYAAAGPAVAAVAPMIATAAPAFPAATPAAVPPGGAASGQRLVAFFSDYFGRNLPLFVTFWLLGILFLSLRFTGGMLYVQRLKYRQNRPLPGLWQERLERLAARAGLRRKLRLLESLRLATPVVVGHLKPVLLLPAGFVTGLPLDEVEALLAHELAHVMRRDYLVNLLQNLVEILFFFHPGVRWISACVRQEREHCCDDFAVELCGDPQNYARALARLQVSAAAFREPALAAAGSRKGMLLRRITRLLGRPRLGAAVRPRLARDFREGFLSALLLAIGLLAVVKLAATPGTAKAAAETKPKPVAATPASAAGRFACVSFVLEADGSVRLAGENGAGAAGSPGTWIVDEHDGRVVWYMDLASRAKTGGTFSEDVALGRGAYSWYRPTGWKVTASWQGKAGKGAWQPLTMFIGSGRSPLLRRHEDELLRANQEKLLQRELAHAEYESQLQEEERQKLAGELRVREEHERQLEEERLLREEEERLRSEELRVRDLARQKGLEEGRMRLEADRLRQEENRLRQVEARLRDEELKIKNFMAELADSGLVEKGKSYRIELSGSALVINGKKQPAAVHEKIRKFYETLTNRKLDDKKPVTIAHDPE